MHPSHWRKQFSETRHLGLELLWLISSLLRYIPWKSFYLLVFCCFLSSVFRDDFTNRKIVLPTSTYGLANADYLLSIYSRRSTPIAYWIPFLSLENVRYEEIGKRWMISWYLSEMQ